MRAWLALREDAGKGRREEAGERKERGEREEGTRMNKRGWRRRKPRQRFVMRGGKS